jgi:hypothetical protein
MENDINFARVILKCTKPNLAILLTLGCSLTLLQCILLFQVFLNLVNYATGPSQTTHAGMILSILKTAFNLKHVNPKYDFYYLMIFVTCDYHPMPVFTHHVIDYISTLGMVV